MNDDEKAIKAFHALLADLVENILRYADNPGACVQYVTTQIRELVGVRMVAIVAFEGGSCYKLVGICPQRKEAEWNQPEVQEFISAMIAENSPQIIDPVTNPVGRSLQAVGMGKSFAIPLMVSEEKVGMLVLLDFMDDRGTTTIFEAFSRIASIVALILKNSLLYKNLEQQVVLRTKQLTEKEKFFRAIFEQSAVGVALLDTNTSHYINTNKRFCEILGYTPEALRSIDFRTITHPDDLAQNIDYMEQMISGKIYEYSMEKRYIHRSGHPVWTNVSVSPLWEKGADPDYHIVVVTNIGERKLAEKLLMQSEERFRRAVEEAPFPIMIHAENGEILALSRSWTELSGYTHADIPTMALWTEKAYGIHKQDVLEGIKNLYSLEQRTAEGEYTITCRDGAQCIWDFRSVSLGTLPDNRRTALSMAADVTTRKQAEQELNEKNAELERFNYTVSHDLKSPLITIQAYAGMIIRDMEAGNYRRAESDLGKIERAAGKMTALLNDLLELSRVGRVMNTQEKINMNFLLKEVLLQLEGTLWQQQIEAVIDPNLPSIYGDRLRIAEVMQNLVENAVKYMGDQAAPRIDIGVRQDDTEKVFFVQDNGMGIKPRYQENIFGLFNKLDPASDGTGVGLALVKRIIDIHGGRIWVESEGEGLGSRFCFTVGSNG